MSDINQNRVSPQATQPPFPRETDQLPFPREIPRDSDQTLLSGNQSTTPRSVQARSAHY